MELVHRLLGKQFTIEVSYIPSSLGDLNAIPITSSRQLGCRFNVPRGHPRGSERESPGLVEALPTEGGQGCRGQGGYRAGATRNRRCQRPYSRSLAALEATSSVHAALRSFSEPLGVPGLSVPSGPMWSRAAEPHHRPESPAAPSLRKRSS